MLRIIERHGAADTAKYFDASLATTDYYVRECGTWAGKGAERLGLAGQVRREDFMALANNKAPGTDQRITVRLKEDRRTGYDFCFAVPKSVSLYLAETGDKAVEQMILEAFNETMTDVEARMETRVRIGGPDRDRTTGNMVYASFIHTTGRPIEGICDPHWHIHAFTFNATFDPQEKRWKAGQFGNIKADAPFYEAAFNNYLAGKLVAAGYGVRRTDKHFELASVSRELIEKFSKRTRLVEQFIRENHTALYAKARALVKKTGMEFADAFAHVKSEIGARTRKKKTENKLTAEEQLASWRSQMTPAERVSLQKEVVKGTPNENLLDPELAKELAIKHLYERASVARALHAAGMLLRRGLGRVTVDQAKAFAQHDKRFIRPDFAGKLVTTREVLEEEKAMIELASAGRGAYASLGNGSEWQCAEGISDEQARVVEHLLKSKDLVTSVRGPAGSGKTTMMKEAVKAIAALSGRNVIVAAPSSSAVGILKKDDFSKSDTVQRFMLDELLQEAARGQVLWVDEAGFLSASDMRWLVEFASKNDCRLILSGDTRQHHGVERGDALRVMETNGVVTQAALTEIFRQQIPALRAAVHDLSQGKSAEGFDKLDKFGAIQEIEDNAQRLSAIVRTHLAAVELKRTSLVVAPTHAECRAIAEAVRAELKKTGLLAETERVVTRLQNTGLTESQRRDPINYERGQVVEFHRLSKGGFKSGQQWEVLRREAGQVMIGRAGQERLLPLSSAAKFNLYEREKIEVAPGDRIRVSKNFQSAGRRFRNNELLTVTGIGDGKITVEAGEIISRGALHIDQGVCVTSHASQGKTVDQVIVSVPVRSFTHANDAQFYVSMSRARHAMYLFTDSKAALREAVCRPSERLSPWELLEGNRREKALVKEALQSPKRRLPIPTMELPTQERGLGYERG